MSNNWFTRRFSLRQSAIQRHNRDGRVDFVERLNDSVNADDELYFLGDFCIGGPRSLTVSGSSARKVYFVRGIHDRATKKIWDQFIWVKKIAKMNVRSQPIVLCHYAMWVYAPQRGSGSHGTLYLGSSFTVVKDLKKELGPGLVTAMCKQMGIRQEDL